jgi:hypothetical protein
MGMCTKVHLLLQETEEWTDEQMIAFSEICGTKSLLPVMKNNWNAISESLKHTWTMSISSRAFCASYDGENEASDKDKKQATKKV